MDATNKSSPENSSPENSSPENSSPENSSPEASSPEDSQTTSAEPRYSESSAVRNSPRLSTRTLTIMLALMCAVPGIVIFSLTKLMPPTAEGQLEGSLTRVGVPTEISYYEVEDIGQRKEVSEAALVLKNEGDCEWKYITVRINNHYNIMDTEGSIPPGGEQAYQLNRALSRTGARFDLRQLPLHHVSVDAKQIGKGSRANLQVEYPEMIKSRGPWLTVMAILFVVAVFSVAGGIWYWIWRREAKLAEQV